MNKNVLMTILIVMFFLVLGAGVYYYFLTKNAERMALFENSYNQKSNNNKTKKKIIDLSDQSYDDGVKMLKLFSKNIKDENKKNSLKRNIAYKLLAKRDEASILKAINGFKEIIETTKDNEVKAKNLNNLANLYFRTGGSSTVFKEVFSGKYAKYVKDANGNVGKTLIALYKEAYNTYPNPRSAVELAFWYADMNNLQEAEKWVKVTESYEVKKDNVKIRQFEAYGKMAILDRKYFDKFKESFKKINEEIKSFDVKKGNYRNGSNQNIPFLELFYISTLYEIDSKKYKNKINIYAEKIVEFVENDPESKYNEFQYFLNIQKNKKEMDVMAKDLNGIAKLSPKFKAFLEKYGFEIK